MAEKEELNARLVALSKEAEDEEGKVQEAASKAQKPAPKGV